MIIFRILNRIYEFLWRNTLGRPWTYAVRQATRDHWYARLIAILAYSAVLGIPAYFAPTWLKPIIVLAYFGSFAAGHFWWDTEGDYVRHEEDFTYLSYYDYPATGNDSLGVDDD